jgi:hypothetical protein
MRGLVETLEATSNSHAHSMCLKQRRLFKALYDVAAKYVQVKRRVEGGQGGISWSTAQQQYADAFAGTTSNGLRPNTLGSGGVVGSLGATNAADAAGHIPLHDGANGGDGMGLVDGLFEPTALQNTAFGDVDMEMDLSGAQLWDWFNKNQSIMRMLEDT